MRTGSSAYDGRAGKWAPEVRVKGTDCRTMILFSLGPMTRFPFRWITVESGGGVGEIQVFAGRKAV